MRNGPKLIVALLATMLIAAGAGHAAEIASGDGLAVTIGADGAIFGVSTDGRTWPTSAAPSGLLLRDVAADGEFVPAGGAVSTADGEVVHAGVNQALGLEFRATWRGGEGAVRVDGFIRDTTGADRAITVRLALPVDAVGGTWWPDILGAEPIGRELHRLVRDVGVGATGSASTYTWAAISADPGELCLGIPLDHFVVHRIEYDGAAGLFYVDFDFGLAPETEAFPSRADFHAVIFRADPAEHAARAPGFRSATEAYYRIYPESFVRRSEAEGLWMPFTSPSKVEGFEDFGFVFHEGANEMGWDDAHDILSFPYVSPHWAMLWMPDVRDQPSREFVLQRLAQSLADPNDRSHRQAQLVATSGIMNGEGQYHFTIGRAHWAPSDFGPVGWFANFPANADPDLEGLGRGETTGGQAWRSVQSTIEDNAANGIFVDGIYFDGVDERPTDNYNRAHWRFASAPLTFGTETRRPCMCGPFASYKFVARVAEYLHPTGRLTMANGVPAQFPFPYHYLDVTGREIEPPIDNDPVSIPLLAMSRTFSHHKPCVYLYKPRLEERFDRDLSPYLLDYMNTCLLYAAEPSLFKIFSRTNEDFYYSFFERPDWYNRYRPLFVEYVPLVRELALAGWEPVTHARADDARVSVERFGTGESLRVVAYNPEHVATVATPVHVDLTALGWPAGAAPQVVDLVSGDRPSLSTDAGGLSIALSLPPRRAAVLAFAAQPSPLAALDLTEAQRYLGVAGGRMRDLLEQRLPIDFEDDPDGDGDPAGFTHYREGTVEYASDTQVWHSPPRSTRITLHATARGTQSVRLPAEAGRTYRVSVWVKTAFVGDGGAHVYVQWLDQGGRAIGNSPTSASVAGVSEWAEITHEVVAPEGTAGLSLVLVSRRSGEGAGVVWLDDPRAVQVGADGQESVLLPLAREAPPGGGAAATAWLADHGTRVAALLASARAGTEVAGLARELLTEATAVEAEAAALRGQSDAYSAVAAALDTCAWRLRRAVRLLVGWRVALTGRPRVAQGEPVEFTVELSGAGAEVRDLAISVEAPPGWEGAVIGDLPTTLAPGRTAAASVRLTGGDAGGSVRVVTTGRVAGGDTMTVAREAAFEVVPAVSTSLAAGGQAEGGREQRLTLLATNARREAPAHLSVRVTAPPGFGAEPTERTVEIAPDATEPVPLRLTAGADVQPGWQAGEVRATWDGGAQSHPVRFLFLPDDANLLENPGMEAGDAAQATGWADYGTGGYDVDAAVRHSGGRALRTAGAGEAGQFGAVQRLVLNQTQPRALVIRGWSLYQPPGATEDELQTIGMTENAGAGAGEISRDYAIYVDLHFVGGGALYGQTAGFDRAARGWQFAQSVIRVNRPVADATVYLLFRNQAGAAWFDDVFVGELPPNLAVEAGARADVDSSFSGYGPAALNDAVVEVEGVPWDLAAWASAETLGEHWAQIEFPEPHEIRSAALYWALDNGGTWSSRDFTVQAEVDGTWRDVAAVRGLAPEPMSVLQFTPVTTSRVRVLQAPSGGPAERPNIMWLREIELY